MKTLWWLSVFMLIDGNWVPGDEVELQGWAPRSYESREICDKRRAFAEKAIDQARSSRPNMPPTKWVCNPGEPAKAPPADAE